MNSLNIIKVFNEEDKKFNKIMVDIGKISKQSLNILNKKDESSNTINYDFTSDIIQDIRSRHKI